MYAIIETGGKQYRVEKGTRLHVEKLPGENGSEVEIPKVLLVSAAEGAKIGRPFVEGSKVLATVVGQIRGPKVIVFKRRAKKGYKRTQGHRQDLTEIEIKEVTA
ncbi:MAG: 50S ribosomal protein L21 [Elusimicrobia bacterium RIFCSPLOWO2_01_FULL_64_13]|nr:MAG: 50S ribosomal protein L21 [Elusimicrobia bacterium RIFCSPHIGHO2_01_FULL_64_10]OGR97902.1 MAG: 50S ribosomal protein L21 [Elusimicrobia bacterium RIFCSPLOWO2_01_FULL_64_13]